ncbi:MAG: right-handed parallel beta-helix repeat-containing protein [Candidatus Diapherotrites archaeon]
MQKILLIGLLATVFLLSGCVKETGKLGEESSPEIISKVTEEKECNIKEDCPDKTCFTKDCIDYNCSYSQIAPCCGNGICEPGETYEECADDCVKSGVLNKDEVGGGTSHVTGDIDVIEGVNLTILPGTVIKVALTDDQHKGSDEPITDPNNFPKDPPFYEKEKITIYIGGTLNAVGTADNRIIFTSDSENPTTHDWRGIDIVHGRLEYAIVEYAQGNIQIQHSSDVVLSNNIIRNSLTCCICVGHSNQVSPQILDNEIYNCGHEGIDYAGGSAIIKGNYFHVENPEIQPDPFKGRLGIVVYKNAYPTIEDNVFEKLSTAILFLGNSLYEEAEGKVILRNNSMENIDIEFDINPDYPAETIVIEND